MKLAEQSALQALVGRALSAEELLALEPLVEARNDVGTAAALSAGRVKHGPTQIGPGTIVAVLGDAGGAFLDDLQALGQTDRAVYWAMNPITRGVFDLSIQAARTSLANLKAKMPDHVGHIDTVLTIGLMPDPIPFDQVSRVLNEAQGLLTL